MSVPPGRSETSAVRLLTAGIGLATVISVAGVNSLNMAGSPAIATGWYGIVTLAVLGVPLLGAVLAFWASRNTLRVINAATVLAQFALLATWLPLTLAADATAGALPAGLPWILATSVSTVAAAVIAFGPLGGVAVLGVLSGSVALFRGILGLETLNSIAYDMHTFVTSLVGCVLTSALIHAARSLDRAAAVAVVVAEQQAAAEARRSIQVATDAMVHDEILATLLLAAQNAPEFRTAVADQSRGALRLIEELAAPLTGAPAVSLDDLVRDAGRTTRRLDATARFHHSTTPGQTMPADVAAALHSALAQALANSVAHAGDGPVNRIVEVTGTTAMVTVTVSDDGQGFDADRVPADRMGITTSILGRLDNTAGGSALATSVPGEGTTVTLSWSPPAPQRAETQHPVGTGRYGARHRGFDLGVRLTVITFVLAQAVLAANQAVNSPQPLPAVLALGSIYAAVALLGWRSLAQPDLVRSLAILGTVTASSAIVLWPTLSGASAQWDTWYLTANSVLLAALALRKRIGLAWLGLALMMVLSITSVYLNGHPATDAARLLTRPTALLTVSSVLGFCINRMLERITVMHAGELAATKTLSFEANSARERQSHSVNLGATVGPLLTVLAR
ncbi:MAG: ATP-binding protein, partial [Cryobacterium sp.]